MATTATPPPATAARPQNAVLALAAAGLAVVLWSYWSTLDAIAERWTNDPAYSHGFLVPLFSVYLLWLRRDRLAGGVSPAWWGVGIVLLAGGMRLAGHFLYQSWLDAASLPICLAGLVAAAGGWKALKWAAPGLLFLAFMLPLPYKLQTMLGGQLQRLATVVSTYVLQTVGVPAVAEGNVILLSTTKLGVVEACSGLSMLMTFFALAVAVAILADTRSIFERLVIVASALPIAVAANVVRIVVTSVLYEMDKGELARRVYHDLAGWLMMPLALGMLLVELFVLGRAIVPVAPSGPRRPGLAPLVA
jgi:exosortase